MGSWTYHLLEESKDRFPFTCPLAGSHCCLEGKVVGPGEVGGWVGGWVGLVGGWVGGWESFPPFDELLTGSHRCLEGIVVGPGEVSGWVSLRIEE